MLCVTVTCTTADMTMYMLTAAMLTLGTNIPESTTSGCIGPLVSIHTVSSTVKASLVAAEQCSHSINGGS